MRYTTVPNWKTQLHGAVGFNEAGVGISGTESIYAKDELLILPRAKTAREGVQILGSIVEKIGAGEGFGVAFVDEKELWYLETGTGHQWIAQRLPRDQYFASGNQGRLQAYDPKSEDFMASKNLVKWAADNGFYNEKKDGAFNFAKVYTRDDERDRVYNDPRVWQVQKILTPSLKQPVQEGRSFPVYAKPDKKVTLEDMKSILRNHYESGELQSHDPYTKGLRGDEEFRPISVFRTYESHVMQVRPWMPREIGSVIYVAMGMPNLSVYVPYYHGLDAYPAHYGMGTNEADSQSVYWKYRKLQTLVMTDYPKLAPIVEKAYHEFEADTAKKQKAFEEQYLKTYKKDAKKADKMLNEFNLGIMASAEKLAEDLTNQIFTIRTADIQKANFFANRSKKD